MVIVLAAVMLWILRWSRGLRCLKNISSAGPVSPAPIVEGGGQFWFRFPLWLGCFKWRVEMLVWCLRGFRWCLEMLVILGAKMLAQQGVLDLVILSYNLIILIRIILFQHLFIINLKYSTILSIELMIIFVFLIMLLSLYTFCCLIFILIITYL